MRSAAPAALPARIGEQDVSASKALVPFGSALARRNAQAGDDAALKTSIRSPLRAGMALIFVFLGGFLAWGSTVPIAETIDSFKRVVAGEFDHLPEAAFYMVGGINEVIAKAEKMAAEAA